MMAGRQCKQSDAACQAILKQGVPREADKMRSQLSPIPPSRPGRWNSLSGERMEPLVASSPTLAGGRRVVAGFMLDRASWNHRGLDCQVNSD